MTIKCECGRELAVDENEVAGCRMSQGGCGKLYSVDTRNWIARGAKQFVWDPVKRAVVPKV